MTQADTISISRRTIAYGAARRLVDAAIGHAGSHGWQVAVAVVDVSGDLVALGRMDGVTPAVVEFATDKAYTAAMVSLSTKAFANRMAGEAELTLGLSTRRRMLAWEGGLPIVDNGVVIGGIGVSGVSGPDDAACGAIALAQLGLGSEGA